MKKRYVKWGVFVVAIVIAFFVYRYISDQLAFNRIDRGGEPASARQYESYTKDLDARYMNDKYGSTTPEGTLELFVKALEKEDVVLASKYFVAEKQIKMEEELGEGLRSGGVKSLVLDLESQKIKAILGDYRVRFDTVDKNNIVEFSFDLRLNKFTQKWKIESL